MRRSLLVALLAACALVSSCGGGSGDDPFSSGPAEPGPTRWATAEEFAWLSRLGDWNDELDDALDAAIEAEEDEERVERILSEPGPERRSYLEQNAENRLPDKTSKIVLYCAGGNRSALAAKVSACSTPAAENDVRLLKFGSPVRWNVLFVDPCSPG